jgi:hypothetical protein
MEVWEGRGDGCIPSLTCYYYQKRKEKKWRHGSLAGVEWTWTNRQEKGKRETKSR